MWGPQPVLVCVKDENDQVPHFSQFIYRVQLSQGTRPGECPGPPGNNGSGGRKQRVKRWAAVGIRTGRQGSSCPFPFLCHPTSPTPLRVLQSHPLLASVCSPPERAEKSVAHLQRPNMMMHMEGSTRESWGRHGKLFPPPAPLMVCPLHTHQASPSSSLRLRTRMSRAQPTQISDSTS